MSSSSSLKSISLKLEELMKKASKGTPAAKLPYPIDGSILRLQLPKFDETMLEDVAKSAEERIQREIDTVDTLKEMVDILNTEADRQKKVNRCLIVLAALTVIASVLFGLLNLLS